MLALLKFADARMGEPSTWAALAVILGLAHVNVDPGLLHVASLWGAVASGVLGVVLSEVGTKPGGQIAVDAVAALVAAVKAMPDTAKSAAVVLGIVVGLSACTAPQQQTAATIQTAAQTDLVRAQGYARDAIYLWGVVKGIAQVAEVANPSLRPDVDAVVAFVDPKVAEAQAALDMASTDAAALLALASAITVQANALTNTAAPDVVVAPRVPDQVLNGARGS